LEERPERRLAETHQRDKENVLRRPSPQPFEKAQSREADPRQSKLFPLMRLVRGDFGFAWFG